MPKPVTIRFVGEKGSAFYTLKLGEMDLLDPPTLEFEGSDEIFVGIKGTEGVPDCVDIVFEDGEVALEVPRDFFVILGETEKNG